MSHHKRNYLELYLKIGGTRFAHGVNTNDTRESPDTTYVKILLKKEKLFIFMIQK